VALLFSARTVRIMGTVPPVGVNHDDLEAWWEDGAVVASFVNEHGGNHMFNRISIALTLTMAVGPAFAALTPQRFLNLRP
jgi:hypothetical protein